MRNISLIPILLFLLSFFLFSCGDDKSTDGGACSSTNLNGSCDTGLVCKDGECVALCTPETCDNLSVECGTVDDGCGNVLNCGSCDAGMACNSAGECIDICISKTCEDLNVECGTTDDGCGNTLNCGTCENGMTCNSAGECVVLCTPKTCGDLNIECGAGDDGCGNTLNCGTCDDGMACNSNGECIDICTPTTCEDLNIECGTTDDSCGNTLNCGTCDDGMTCNSAGECVVLCTPKTCEDLNIECGAIDNGCGNTLNCGTCDDGMACNSNGECVVLPCIPDTCNSLDRECGPIDNGCGEIIYCGECGERETCNQEGFCEPLDCLANCVNRECGSDGCGGSCGSCNNGDSCSLLGFCETPGEPGEPGGECVDSCNDSNNLCLGREGEEFTCFQHCYGEGDFCIQEDYFCQNVGAEEDEFWLCLPDIYGEVPIGGDCSNENCVQSSVCLNEDNPTCYEYCFEASHQCALDGYSCVDTGNLQIGMICAPNGLIPSVPLGGSCDDSSQCMSGGVCLNSPEEGKCYEPCSDENYICSQEGYVCTETGIPNVEWVCALPDLPGDALIGEPCSQENNCVEEAICLSKAGADTLCYEKCDPDTGGECSLPNHFCFNSEVAQIGWICIENENTDGVPIGGTCDEDNNCVAEAGCLGPPDGPYTCYERCTDSGDICEIDDYTCQVAADGNYCVPNNEPGNVPIGGDCSSESCVEEANCLSDGMTSLCYEICDPNSGTVCEMDDYSCEPVAGDDYCIPPQD